MKNSKKRSLSIHLSSDFFKILSRKTLLLDTSVFGDAIGFQEEFLDFFKECKKNEIVLMTLPLVSAEFLRGTQTKVDMEKKREFIGSIIDAELPITPDLVVDHLFEVIKMYGENGRDVSIVDFMLAASAKKYTRDLYVMTKNPKDFPGSIFSLRNYMVLQKTRALQIYGVYKFGTNKRPKKIDEPPF